MTEIRKIATALCTGVWLTGAVLGVAACSPTIQREGSVPDADQAGQIKPGVDDKNRVTQLLGSPSAVSAFQDRTWYYISRRTEQTAFLDPQVVEQEVLAISFDAQNIVQDLKVYGLEDG